MNGGPLVPEALFALCLAAFVLWIVRWSIRSDKELGRKAYRDGIHYNPKWGASVCEGWREAKAEEVLLFAAMSALDEEVYKRNR